MGRRFRLFGLGSRGIGSGSSPSTPSFEFDVQATTTFTLPLVSAAPLDFVVDWGDGISDNITVWNQAEKTHTYASAGLYTVKITGDINGWSFNNAGDKLLMREVRRCDALTINKISAFMGCTNMTWNTNDAPTITTADLTTTFYACSNFNGDISTWDVSGVQTFANMLRSCPLFNQPIGVWDMSSAVNLSSMFRDSAGFNQDVSDWNVVNVTDATAFMVGKSSFNYDASKLDAIYNKWSLLTLKPNVPISFGTIKYTAAGSAGKAILTSAPNNWTIIDGGI